MLMPGTTASGMRNTGRSCRALSAKGSSLLLACCWLARRTTATHPFRSTTPLCPRAIHLHRSSSNIPPGAGTCREHAQAKYAKSWDTRILLCFSDTLPSRYTATSHTRAQARTHLLVHRSLTAHAHHHLTTTTTLEHPPPPALLLLTSSTTYQHDTLLPHLSAVIPRFLWQSITACPRASQDR